jgi:hypothetical protein
MSHARKGTYLGTEKPDLPPTDYLTIWNGRPQQPQSFPLFMADRQGDKVMTYHQERGGWVWYNDEDYKGEMKRLKKLMKKGILNIDEENNMEYEYDGVKWYSIVFNQYDKDGDGVACLCIGSLQIFDTLVDGYSYYFINKADRDNIYKHMTKK